MDVVRRPAEAGMFYPDNPEQLQQTLHSLLLDAVVPDCLRPPPSADRSPCGLPLFRPGCRCRLRLYQPGSV